MKKTHFFKFILLALFTQFVVTYASAQNNRIIKIDMPGHAPFICTSISASDIVNGGKTEGTFSVTKKADNLDQVLRSAASSGRINSLTIDFYNATPNGDFLYKRISLRHISMRQFTTSGGTTQFQLVYTQMAISYIDNTGVHASDDWETASQ